MHVTNQKAEFSIAFIHAVASVAGCTFIGPPDVDDDSVDLELGATRRLGSTRRAPRLSIQAKCTETDDGTGVNLSFPLPMKNYDDLRDQDLHVPRILVVLCVPPDLSAWLQETPEHTAMRRVAYWSSLRGAPAVVNETKKTVHLLRTQRFTVAALKEMMTRIGDGGCP
jgi:hypothetical protein